MSCQGQLSRFVEGPKEISKKTIYTEIERDEKVSIPSFPFRTRVPCDVGDLRTPKSSSHDLNSRPSRTYVIKNSYQKRFKKIKKQSESMHMKKLYDCLSNFGSQLQRDGEIMDRKQKREEPWKALIIISILIVSVIASLMIIEGKDVIQMMITQKVFKDEEKKNFSQLWLYLEKLWSN